MNDSQISVGLAWTAVISARDVFHSTADLVLSPLSALQNDRLAFGEEARGIPAGMYEQGTKISIGTKPTKFSVGTKLFRSKWTNLVLAIMGDLFKVDKTCFSHFEGLSDFCWSVPLSALQYDCLTFGEEAR